MRRFLFGVLVLVVASRCVTHSLRVDARLALISPTDTSKWIQSVLFHDGLVYALTENDLIIYAPNRGDDAAEVGRVTLAEESAPGGTLATDGHVLFVATIDHRYLFDLTDPKKPTELWRSGSDKEWNADCGAAAIFKNTLYVNTLQTSRSLRAFDLSKPKQPVLLTTYADADTGGALIIDEAKGLMYVGALPRSAVPPRKSSAFVRIMSEARREYLRYTSRSLAGVRGQGPVGRRQSRPSTRSSALRSGAARPFSNSSSPSAA